MFQIVVSVLLVLCSFSRLDHGVLSYRPCARHCSDPHVLLLTHMYRGVQDTTQGLILGHYQRERMWMEQIKSVYSCLFMRVCLKLQLKQKGWILCPNAPKTHNRKAQFTQRSLPCFMPVSSHALDQENNECQGILEIKSCWYLWARTYTTDANLILHSEPFVSAVSDLQRWQKNKYFFSQDVVENTLWKGSSKSTSSNSSALTTSGS